MEPVEVRLIQQISDNFWAAKRAAVSSDDPLWSKWSSIFVTSLVESIDWCHQHKEPNISAAEAFDRETRLQYVLGYWWNRSCYLRSYHKTKLGDIKAKHVMEREAKLFKLFATEFENGEHPKLTIEMHIRFVVFCNDLIKKLYESKVVLPRRGGQDGTNSFGAGNNSTVEVGVQPGMDSQKVEHRAG